MYKSCAQCGLNCTEEEVEDCNPESLDESRKYPRSLMYIHVVALNHPLHVLYLHVHVYTGGRETRIHRAVDHLPCLYIIWYILHKTFAMCMYNEKSMYLLAPQMPCITLVCSLPCMLYHMCRVYTCTIWSVSVHIWSLTASLCIHSWWCGAVPIWAKWLHCGFWGVCKSFRTHCLCLRRRRERSEPTGQSHEIDSPCNRP